jgi:hypothetical protein
LAKGDDQYAMLLPLPLPLPLMLWWCCVWTISEIRSFRRPMGSKMLLLITGAPIAVAVIGENIVAAGNTENEFVAVVVVVPAVPDPSCFILLAGGGTSRASSW